MLPSKLEKATFRITDNNSAVFKQKISYIEALLLSAKCCCSTPSPLHLHVTSTVEHIMVLFNLTLSGQNAENIDAATT